LTPTARTSDTSRKGEKERKKEKKKPSAQILWIWGKEKLAALDANGLKLPVHEALSYWCSVCSLELLVYEAFRIWGKK
jgi:hypothetical protein